MSDEKIAEIRARHERDNRYGDGLYPGAHKDRAWLLAEVERLRAENARLRAQIVEYFREPGTHEVEQRTRERDEARAEVENLYDQVHRWVDDRAKAQARADRLREQNYELQRERDEARAEVERLRAENDEKQALIDAARAHRNNLRAEIAFLCS